jgi:hypothetical protein
MNHQLLQYIAFAKEHKMPASDIRANLVSAGWDAAQVDAALAAGDDALLMPPPPPGAPVGAAPSGGVSGRPAGPIAVTEQRTTRGLEYTIMFLAMAVTAVSLGALLHNLVDGAFGHATDDNGFVTYATAALIVSLPIFALLFLRLKRAEAKGPELRHDPSRRHSVQLTLIVTFLWGLFRLVAYIYSLLNPTNDSYLGSNISSAGGNFLHTLITVGIAGLIFVYYWIDEHKKDKS